MTIPEIDIFRTAKIIIDQYGDAAEIEAMSRRDSFESINDFAGSQVWERVLIAIRKLTSQNHEGHTAH